MYPKQFRTVVILTKGTRCYYINISSHPRGFYLHEPTYVSVGGVRMREFVWRGVFRVGRMCTPSGSRARSDTSVVYKTTAVVVMVPKHYCPNIQDLYVPDRVLDRRTAHPVSMGHQRQPARAITSVRVLRRHGSWSSDQFIPIHALSMYTYVCVIL